MVINVSNVIKFDSIQAANVVMHELGMELSKNLIESDSQEEFFRMASKDAIRCGEFIISDKLGSFEQWYEGMMELNENSELFKLPEFKEHYEAAMECFKDVEMAKVHYEEYIVPLGDSRRIAMGMQLIKDGQEMANL